MKIVDSMIFYNEFDMLELKFNIMYDKVDRFVIVESDHTFTNKPKEYNFEKHAQRYQKWLDKVVYVKLQSPKFSDPWQNEHWQRDQMAHGWQDLTEEDVVIISDCDEIIRPEVLDFIRNTEYNYYGLYIPMSFYKFNYVNLNNEYDIWITAYRGNRGKPSEMRRTGNERNERYRRPSKAIYVHHAGWHFSYHGNTEFIQNKIQNFSHQEFNNEKYLNNINVEEHIKNGTEHMMRTAPGTWQAVQLDDYYPKVILDNKQKYQKWIYDGGFKSIKECHPRRILEQEI